MIPYARLPLPPLLKARDLGVKQLHSVIHGHGIGGMDFERCAEAVVEGTLLGLYRFHELKTQLDNIRENPTSLTLFIEDPQNIEQVNNGVTKWQDYCGIHNTCP